jgi:hypothetical protein
MTEEPLLVKTYREVGEISANVRNLVDDFKEHRNETKDIHGKIDTKLTSHDRVVRRILAYERVALWIVSSTLLAVLGYIGSALAW